ncbi:MAG: rod shape-determining protein [Planctomycetes bacterium]|nr:rod shape-determining protein [Planctomycetota bacterium]
MTNKKTTSHKTEGPTATMDPSRETSNEVKKDHGVLYLGIDLGTSRTSVASSNGQRVTISSHVGYPKDVVAQKLLKKDVLFGDEAVDNRPALDFYRPLAHGVIKATSNERRTSRATDAAADLIREIIRLSDPRKDELVYAVIGVPAQAAIHHKDAIIKAARESVDSVMLCSEPFSVAYGLDMLDDTLVIDIGAGTTDLCRMHGTMPEDSDQITNTFAGDYVDNQFSKLVKEKHPTAQFSVQMLRNIKERYSSVVDNMQPAITELPVNGKPTSFDLTNELRTACRSIVAPMVEGLGQLISTFDPEFQERLKNRVLLAGGGSQIKGLDIAIEEEMKRRLGGGKVLRIEEPMYGGANGALKIAHDMPAEYWEKLK